MAKDIKNKSLYESAKRGKGRAGKLAFLRHQEGVRLTQKQAISAKCFDCDGMGDSGECLQDYCPLYPYSPYRKSPETLAGGRTEKKKAK